MEKVLEAVLGRREAGFFIGGKVLGVLRFEVFLSAVYYRMFGYSNLLDVLMGIRQKLIAYRDYRLEMVGKLNYLPGICSAANAVFGKSKWECKWFKRILWQRYRSQFSPTLVEYRQRYNTYWFFGKEEFTVKTVNNTIFGREVIMEWYCLRIDFMNQWINEVEKKCYPWYCEEKGGICKQ
jgi:hypothetical protein